MSRTSSDRVLAGLASGRYRPTVNADDCAGFDFALITVPTPLRDGVPDLSYIEHAAEAIAPLVTSGACVVLESTTYPGTTEELLVPILENGSHLIAGQDFFVGYSPERMDPGNPRWRLANTPKVVSGIDARIAGLGAGVLCQPGRAHRHRPLNRPGRAGQADGEHLPARQHRAGQRAGYVRR